MKYGAWLALAVLAGLSFGQAQTWSSDATLWAAVYQANPDGPRAPVNLAVEALAKGDLSTASRWLDVAEPLARRQGAFDRAWSLDVIEANRAILDIQAGRLDVARLRLEGAPASSMRARVCATFPEVCR